MFYGMTAKQAGRKFAEEAAPAYYMNGESEEFKESFLEGALDRLRGYGREEVAQRIQQVWRDYGTSGAARALDEYESGDSQHG